MPVLSVVNADGSTESGSLIDEIVREGARQTSAAALEAEVHRHTTTLVAENDEVGRPLLVRSGYRRPRRGTDHAA